MLVAAEAEHLRKLSAVEHRTIYRYKHQLAANGNFLHAYEIPGFRSMQRHDRHGTKPLRRKIFLQHLFECVPKWLGGCAYQTWMDAERAARRTNRVPPNCPAANLSRNPVMSRTTVWNATMSGFGRGRHPGAAGGSGSDCEKLKIRCAAMSLTTT